MKNINLEQERELFENRLKEQLRIHRNKLNLRISDVIEPLGVGYSTYQRWESTGTRLTDIYSILGVCRVLKFTTTEIIDLLGLPPVKLSELEDIPTDEDDLKSIKEKGICTYIHKNCANLDAQTIETLLDIITDERLKRRQHK